MSSDAVLMEKVREGSKTAFRDLVLKYQKLVYGLAYDLCGNHHEAQDLSQEVFTVIYQSLDSFRHEAKFSTWIYRITVNTWFNINRKRNRKLLSALDSIHDLKNSTKLYDENNSPEKTTEHSILYEHVQKAMTKLSHKERTVFVLRQMHDLKINEIAETINIKPGTVKSLLFRALKKLQKELYFYNC